MLSLVMLEEKLDLIWAGAWAGKKPRTKAKIKRTLRW
jgi:hypothetical protein